MRESKSLVLPITPRGKGGDLNQGSPDLLVLYVKYVDGERAMYWAGSARRCLILNRNIINLPQITIKR